MGFESSPADVDAIKKFIIQHDSQGHICILNDNLFPTSIEEGIYGFPHSGGIGTKSYWRAIASLLNIGKNDILFFHRTSGEHKGCKEIHGPFRIDCTGEDNTIFYDRTDIYPMLIDNEIRCSARFLFTSFGSNYISISKNFELIKKFEQKKIWGLRHPSVMNIGAATKKSIAAITRNQTIELIDLMYSPHSGTIRGTLIKPLPTDTIKKYFRNSVVNSSSHDVFCINDKYITQQISQFSKEVSDEAILYCYILRALKYKNSRFRRNLISDFQKIDHEILDEHKIQNFEKISANAVLELVPSTHLQQTVDIMLCDKEENIILVLEIKKDNITQYSINQTVNYVDLFQTIFPDKIVLGNVIGYRRENDIEIPSEFRNKITTIEYRIENNEIRFF